jgi:hypothetical protein
MISRIEKPRQLISYVVLSVKDSGKCMGEMRPAEEKPNGGME